MNKIKMLLLPILLGALAGCTHETGGLELATYPTTGDVFIDGFTGDLQYAAFGGSDVKAFDVDYEVKYSGTASMKIAVPDANDPNGSYAGGVYYSTTGRNLSGYNCLTFWAKASKSASIDLLGFGNDLGANQYIASISGVGVNTNWKKFYIPIPDPSKLKAEKGMLFYSEGPEDGAGYTFWIDDVRFENLGTIAHSQPQILSGAEKKVTTFNNVSIAIDGMSDTFNLPNGIDQTINVAPAYFEFASSDQGVATVNETGVITVVGGGTSVITAKIAGIDAKGSLTVESEGAFVHAPTPTVAADKVISLFSDTYSNVPVDYFNGYWEPYQTTESADFEVDGNHVLYYVNFNFVGTGFSNPTVNAQGMSHIHFDVFVPKDINGGKLSITVRDFGGDGVDGGDDDTNLTYIFSDLTPGAWNGLDMPLKEMRNRSQVGLIIYENLEGPLNAFYADNIYFYDDGGSMPDVPAKAAPTPTQPADEVLSIFSDAYPNVEGTDFNPNWGQATVVEQVQIEGVNTLLYKGLNYQGTALAGSLDVSGKTHLHLDYYTANSSMLKIFLISPPKGDSPAKEKPYELTVPSSIDWTSVDIPLSEFADVVDLAEIFQFKFEGNGDIYLENIYFYGEGGGTMPDVPTMAAPTPTQPADKVFSIFSGAYPNVEGTDFNPNWGQSTVVTWPVIAGDETMLLGGLDYQGVQFAAPLNVAGNTHLHLDYYTANATSFEIFLISSGPKEKPYSLTVPSSANWTSVDIPLSAFYDVVDIEDIIQFKFVGSGDVYLDNIYFYDEAGVLPEVPTTAAPTPTEPSENVISIFSDAYTNVEGTDFNPGWGQSTIVEQIQIEGNNTLFYKGLNYQGTQYANMDVSGKTYLHLDYYTANSSELSIFLISPGKETPYVLTVPSSINWTSVDIPLSAFSEVVDLTDVFQFKFVGNGDVYLDNIFFY